jgi:hypothetical protein
MFTKLSLLSLLAVIMTATGCKVNKDFSFDINYTKNYYSMNSAYSREDTIRGKDYSSDFDKYKADIKSLSVESATYTITEALPTNPSQTIVNATLWVKDIRGGAQTLVATVNGITLASAIGIESNLNLTDEGKQKITDFLKGSDGAFIATFMGTANEAPINFTVKFKLHLKATYEKTIP